MRIADFLGYESGEQAYICGNRGFYLSLPSTDPSPLTYPECGAAFGVLGLIGCGDGWWRVRGLGVTRFGVWGEGGRLDLFLFS